MVRSLSKGRWRFIWPILLTLLVLLFLWHRKNHPGTGGGTWHRVFLSAGAPLQRASGWILGLPENALGTVRLWLNLQSEKQRLEREVRTLQIDTVRLKGLEAELNSMKEALRKRPTAARNGLFATIVSQDASTWNRSFVVDAGTDQGVREDDPVLSAQGLVGRVWGVSQGTARVLSILDPVSGVSGISVRSRVKGLARGTGRNLMRFEYVEAGADLEPGDLIVTSGLGGLFPKNIPLGTVVKKRISDDGLTLEIEMAPSVDFGSLEHVFVQGQENP